MMKNLSKERLTTIILLLLIIIATLTFIFIRSSKSVEESTNESSEVSGVVKPIVDPEDKIPQEDFTHYLRKAAHFSEFALLGLEIIALFSAYNTKPTAMGYILSLLISMFFAVCDETVQIFSKRGSLISDVWVDLSGAFISVSIFMIIYPIIGRLIAKTKRKRKKTSKQ